MDALRHAIPIFEFAAAGRGQGKHQGTNCFHSAFLLMTHIICHDSPAQCQGFFIFKVQSKCPVWQKVGSNLVRSSVVVVVCDCRTVSAPLTTVLSSLKKCWRAGPYSQKFLAGIIPSSAAKHQDTSVLSPSVPLRMLSDFHLCCGKSYFLYFTPRLFESCSGFQMTLAQKD